MKSDLNARIKACLQEENFGSVKDEIEKIILEFKELASNEKKEKLEAFVADGDSPEDFVMPQDPADLEFEALEQTFRDRLKKHKESERRNELENYEVKKELLKELRNLIDNEEVIGKAFANFKSIQERWNSVGKMAAIPYKEVQHDYRLMVEEFYYKIHIYKELKINDLKKNLELKKDLIARMVKLKDETSIKEIEILQKAYQLEWDNIGPTFKEEWEGIKQEFIAASRALNDKIKNHYRGIRDRQRENLDLKTALVEEVEALLVKFPDSSKDWQNGANKIREIQEKWRKIGFATKSQNEIIWERFKAACNQYFEQKREYFKGLKSTQKGAGEEKRKLIEEAERLKILPENLDDFDWGRRTNDFIRIQKKWKQLGSSLRHEEQKLWKKFRAACDEFFESKSSYYNGKDDRLKENQSKKEAIIAELQKWTPEGAKEEVQEKLKAFSAQWSGIGYVPSKEKRRLQDAFSEAMDSVLDKLGLNAEEKTELLFGQRLSEIKNNDDPIQSLKSERKRLAERLNKMREKQLQYENNLSFFSDKSGNNPLLKEVKEKAEEVVAQMDDIRKLQKRLNIEIHALEKKATEEAEASSSSEESPEA
ncbi:DUF349 domain-containing protein [bacterium SCSIO 12741]|nr:DUF349 domain-containing protein [bacterium SCSIO 12741]